MKKLMVATAFLGIGISGYGDDYPAESGVRLEEIVGLENFGGSDEALAMLLEQGFVVTDETYRQICTFYNDRGPPYFITTDSVLFAYYVNLQDGLMKLEEKQAEKLPPIIRAVREGLKKFWEEGGDEPSELFYAKRSSAGPEWHEASEELDDYLKVAEALATGATAEAETRKMTRAVQKELELVIAAEGPAKSPLRGVPLDYAAFKPKGFYEGNEKLENFYRAVTWLRQVPFRAADADETRQAYVLCYVVKGETLGAINSFQRPYVTYVGESEYANFYDYGDAETRALSAYYDKYGFAKKDDNYWAEVLRELEKLPGPRVTSIPTKAAVADPGLYKGLRLMPPPTDIDNLALRLVAPYGLRRGPPSGEELMALLGSGAAREIIMTREGKAIAAYDVLFESAEAEMPALESEYTSKLWRKRRDVYRALVRAPSDPGLPAYYRHPAWRYKDLNTALAGWAQRRYVWNLHTNRGVACLAARAKPPPAFIEPNLAFFRELLELSVLTDEYYRDYGVADTDFNALSVLLVNLVDILEKQLAGEVLTEEERDYLDHYGPELAVTCGYLRGIWHKDEFLPDTPFCVPFYLDLYTGNERVIGQARPRAIYVLCEYEGRKYCAVGGILTYADHVGPAEGPKRMTVDRWRGLAAEGKLEPPGWQEKFYPGKADFVGLLERGLIREEMFRVPTREMGNVLAQKLARGDEFKGEYKRLHFRGREAAIYLFGLTNHPKVVDLVWPYLEPRPTGWQPSCYRWAPAAALCGKFSNKQADVLMERVRTEHPGYSYLLLELVGTVPTKHGERLLLDFLDESESRFNDGQDKWDCKFALRGLLNRPGMSASEELLERVNQYEGAARRALITELRERWSRKYFDWKYTEHKVRTFTKEEEKFRAKLFAELEKTEE